MIFAVFGEGFPFRQAPGSTVVLAYYASGFVADVLTHLVGFGRELFNELWVVIVEVVLLTDVVSKVVEFLNRLAFFKEV